ncbi:MAG: bacillithiol biosynthesis deacetylase BshB1 [Ignavibacteriae bacterium]|nr:bacillithiol biosynthesis deacetylase BshB1 [Ignavibacteriota bacterium]
MKLDALFVATHPDDIEITSAGTAIKLVNSGKKVGIIDLTRGELSTRGTLQLRQIETERASEVMCIHYRKNLKLPDGNIQNNLSARIKLIKAIRETKPEILFAPFPADRHPDHIDAGNLTRTAAFLSGLRKIKTGSLELHRPRKIYYYRHAYDFPVSFIVDISDTFRKKIKALECYESQFYKQGRNKKTSAGIVSASRKLKPADEPETYLTSRLFWQDLETRARFFGFKIGVEFGEPFFCYNDIKIDAGALFEI